MRNERFDTYQQLEEEFLATETAIAEARRRSARLLSNMHEAQAYFRLPAKLARTEFGAIASAVAGLEAVHENILQAHDAAVATRKTALPEVDFGDVGECNPSTQARKLFPAVAKAVKLRLAS